MKPGKYWQVCLIVLTFVGCQQTDAGSQGQDWLLALGAAGVMQVSPTGGGSVFTPTMSLTVPGGAVSEDTTITYQKTAIPAGQDNIVPLQVSYKFGPSGLHFNKPATMKICYDVQDLLARGLEEKTMQIQYYQPDSGKFVSMGGDVDLVNHCVSAPVYHFSTYVLTAQILAVSNNAPTIGGASFFPARVIEGLPVTVRSSIVDWDPGSSIATVVFYYRERGTAGAFTPIVMLPEANDGNGRFFTARIPGGDVTASGLDYYITATDSLNATATRPGGGAATPDSVLGTMPHATTPIRYQSTVTQMTAGFSRDLTVQVRGTASATYYPVPADTLGFAGGKGTTARPDWLSARYSAQIMGSSALEATYGFLNVSQPITVYPGLLTRIAVLYNSAELPAQPTSFPVNAGSITQFDAVGYDAYDNFTFVLPNFSAGGGIGSFGGPANYAQFFAASPGADTSGTITATVGGLNITYNVLVNGTGAACVFDTGLFDSSCLYN